MAMALTMNWIDTEQRESVQKYLKTEQVDPVRLFSSTFNVDSSHFKKHWVGNRSCQPLG